MNVTMGQTVSPGSTDAQRDHSAWMLMLRGVIAILFGVLAIALPDLTLILLVGLFAAYALLSGAVSIAAGWRSRASDSKWWLVLLLGIVGFCGQIPTLLFAPFTGVLVDRMDRHRILVVTQILSMIQSFAALHLRKLSPW